MSVFTTTPVIGIDVSLWDYKIDVQFLLDNGVKVFVVKIGQNSYLDPKFYKHAENISKYTSQGAILQCYYWDEINSSVAPQVSWLTTEIKKSGYPITFTWVDAEQWWTDWTKYYAARAGTLPYSSVPQPSKANLSAHYFQTYKAVKASLGADKCGFYSNNGFIMEHAPDMANWYAREKINMWIPYYAWQSQPKVATKMTWDTWKTYWFPNYTPKIPAGSSYSQMRGHQCTGDVCIVPGIVQNIFNKPIAADINIFDGAWLSTLGSGTVEPIPPIEQPIPEVKYIVNTWALNVRFGPSTSFAVASTLKKGDTVVVYQSSGEWSKIGVERWVFSSYLTKVSNDIVPPAPIPENRYEALYTLNIYKTSAHIPPVVGWLPIHTEVVVYDVVGNYARIDVGKYVYFPYLLKIK